MSNDTPKSGIPLLSGLQPPDANGLRLWPGFTSRIVARSGVEPLGTSGYEWHGAPDGGATFPTENNEWIYVSNSELPNGDGGVGALRFDAAGNLVDAYSILSGTNNNCAGGPTPWKTWLSCEEVHRGQVWECDPTNTVAPILWPALGRFRHEAVAVDPIANKLYLTEDERDGRLYRFTPHKLNAAGHPDLSSGVLEVARVIGGAEGHVIWLPVPDPSAASEATRRQVPSSTVFKGGEGIWYFNRTIYFATKHDNQIWAYYPDIGYLEIIYDEDFFFHGPLSGVDNVTVSRAGDVYVAEDGGDMQIVAITQSRLVVPVLQIAGHDNSEVTGPAFDPSGTRLYFSSQYGTTGDPNDGVTFEVTGPFIV